MDKLQLRIDVDDVALIADTLADAQVKAAPDVDVADMLRVEAWLRYRLARARHTTSTTPAA